ncbi:hypothetical protein QYE76_058183 [Lolium multiflorum]|uniref:Uncharacterized protein n=1 Tax=Lolium multiflorum TaxID=4521 RepID=A0AAD8T5Q6_LOLMU|nr:hypothetical protein QYE76_058183 [Lolium multiflorum]
MDAEAAGKVAGSRQGRQAAELEPWRLPRGRLALSPSRLAAAFNAVGWAGFYKPYPLGAQCHGGQAIMAYVEPYALQSMMTTTTAPPTPLT